MSVTFDSIVMEAMKNRDTSISTIDALKKQITPYATRKELKETFDKIIKEDPDYIRRYLKASSNIVYQTDVYIDSVETKQKLLYKNIFNNDSVYLNFGNGDKILIVCTDSSLASDNYDFYSDVFVNGIKLSKKNYIEMPSDKVYNFKTGGRRFLIDENKVNVGDIISVVIRKEPRCNSFYTTISIDNVNTKTYTIKKQDVGRYGEILDEDEDIAVLENLLIFKKSSLEKDEQYFQLNTKAFIKEYIPFVDALTFKGTIGKIGSGSDIISLPLENVKKNEAYKVLVAGTYGNFTCNAGDILFALETRETSNVDNWGFIPFNYRKLLILDLSEDNLNKNDVYLIINRKKHVECEFINTTELEDEEYIKYDANNHIILPLVDNSRKVAGCSLPLPVKSINDVEVYVDGYRLINNVDYIFVNDEDRNQYIQFIGILKPNSKVVFRNKNIDDTYNFYCKHNLDKITDYVAFNQEFQNLINIERIPNNTDLVILDTIKCVLYKDEYEEHRYRNNRDMFERFYRVIKNTDIAIAAIEKILESNPEIGKYEEIVVDEVDSILIDEAFIPNDSFEFVNNDRYLDFSLYVKSLVENNKIIINGIKVFDGVMFTKYTDDYSDIIDELVFLEESSVQTNFSYGIIDLDEYSVPICEDYIEVYLGRVRVPVCNKRSIINRYLKIDDQHITLKDAEIYSEINWSDYAKAIINMTRYPNEVRENIYTQLKNVDENNEIKNSWLKIVKDEKLDTNRKVETTDDIYYGRFKKISISTTNASDQKIKQNIYPIFRVLGYYSDEDYIDITEYCDYTFKNEFGEELPDFDTVNVGKQYVTATFNQGENGNLISDSITMEVVAIEVESIRIVSNTNIFTLNDNIFNSIRVIAHYENGNERILTEEEYTRTLTNFDGSIKYDEGIVDSEGSYIISAIYCDHIYDTKSILVSPVSSKRIKKLDVIPNSYLVDGEIITNLDIYATYNNNQIQKVTTDTVDVYVFRDDILDKESSRADYITGLVLDKEYILRLYVFNDDTKTGDPIETLTEDYTDVTIKLLNNNVKNNHQIIYYDNLTATLDENFINKYKDDDNFFYYSIKNLDGVYMSIGQAELTNAEGVMTIGVLNKNEVVAVDFYNKETKEFVQQLLFVVMDVNDIRIAAKRIFTGNIMDGYTIAINKLALNEEYSKIDFTNAALKDINGNTIVKYNTQLVNENNNYTKNSMAQYIYVCFKNFKTSTGNVQTINKYIEKSIRNGKISLDLFFDIEGINKIIELHVPEGSYTNSEFDYFKYEMLDISRVYIDDITYEDENWLIIEPIIPENEIIESVVELRPEASYKTDISASGNDIEFQLKKRESNFETTLDILRCGLNRYCYRSESNNIYVIDVDIVKVDNTAVINTINNNEIEIDN